MHINDFQKLTQDPAAVNRESLNIIDQMAVIRLPQLMKLVGLSRAAIYQRLQPSSPYYDEAFPKQIRLGQRSVGWRLSDVQRYIGNLEKVET